MNADTEKYVMPAVSMNEQPASYVGPVGQTATFSVRASGENLSYPWYYMKPNEKNWSITLRVIMYGMMDMRW